MTFTQVQLEEAYEQMRQERLADQAWAIRAAAKLKELCGVDFSTRVEGHGQWGANHFPSIHPHHINYEIYTTRCQYDNWDDLEQLLEPHCPLDNNVRMQYPKKWYMIRRLFDVSSYPELQGHQKEYKVVVDYYDSHVGGW